MDYAELKRQTIDAIGAERNAIANMANVAALLFTTLPDVNWAGFYLRQGNGLVLGPFQGNPAVSRIALGSGVCGAAAASKRFQLVPDVCAFPGHIVCDVRSKSELVLPIVLDDACYGVLDLDSALLARFSMDDVSGLEAVLAVLTDSSDLVVN